jgi:protein SCO1/2
MSGSPFCRALLALAFLMGTLSGGMAQALAKVPEPAPEPQTKAEYHGGLVSPPLAKPKFTLTDTSGAPFDFWSKTQGSVTLLFFGYTHCPDMCPLQMHVIAQALKNIPSPAAEQFKVVFVTTDPDRDTPTVLRVWLNGFDKHFIGLTGTQAAIDAAQIAANLAPATKTRARPDGAYEVGHAAFVFAYTKDNLAHVIYPVGVKEEDWLHDLPLLVKGAQTN